jgi:hypothetical protein
LRALHEPLISDKLDYGIRGCAKKRRLVMIGQVWSQSCAAPWKDAAGTAASGRADRQHNISKR